MSDLTGRLRLVLDTNVWLDWLVFDDPALAPIRSAVSAGRAEVFIDDTCAAELARVLARKLGRRTLDAAAQAAALAEVRRVARPIVASGDPIPLPKCRDSDDQKFLEAAAAAHADVLITKDEALLELSRRRTRPPPFRIVTPHAFAASAP
ncbi:MAG TPA: putative toxin-antitoxin system toxin component, PIN family [Burkholderiales bacterium]